jgi:hypothetical protein
MNQIPNTYNQYRMKELIKHNTANNQRTENKHRKLEEQTTSSRHQKLNEHKTDKT